MTAGPPRRREYRLSDRIYVAASPIHGRGVFARCRLTAGEYIGTYRGPLTAENGTYVLWVQESEGAAWRGIDGRNHLRYLNHSTDPCAEFDGPHLYALRAIERDEEITFHYGEESGLD